ncbi:MAG: glycine cleavage system aminomethyltransferase GcvT [Planctomycetota bacterium]
MRETPLKALHESLGARLVPFAGWSMPVQYTGILEEAKAVRSAAGLFDLGHMGRVRIRGANAGALLQKVQTNDALKIQPGRIRYALMLDDSGKTQDDVLVYREPDATPEDDGYFLVVNASNAERDLAILRQAEQEMSDVEVKDVTDDLAMIAIQGPVAVEVLASQSEGIDFDALKYYAWANGRVAGVPAQVSRTGYTGEDGFEVYYSASEAERVWKALQEAGASKGVIPCGLGSRDILRLEAGMPLYGHEINETTTPFDAGLHFAVKFTHDFTGRSAIEGTEDLERPVLVGLKNEGRRIPREGYPVFADGGTDSERELGKILSGGASPTLGCNIATVRVPKEFAEPGTQLHIGIRDAREVCTVTALPFYKRER